MTKQRASQSKKWQPDPDRDTLAFQFLSLGRALLDVLNEEPEREQECIARMRTAIAEESEGLKELPPLEGLLPLTAFTLSDEEMVFFGAMEEEDGYVLAAQTENFNIMVSLVYDSEREDVVGGCILDFTGDALDAAHWAAELSEAIDYGDIDPFGPFDEDEDEEEEPEGGENSGRRPEKR